MKKPPHLRELFRKGIDVEIAVGEQVFNLWMQVPSVVQRDTAAKYARGKRARKRNEYRDQDSLSYQLLESEVADLTREQILDYLMTAEETEARRRALNEVLLGDEGSDWGEDGSDYIDVLEAIGHRLEEIDRINAEAAEEEKITPIQDEELIALNKRQIQFDEEVDARTTQLLTAAKETKTGIPTEELRSALQAKFIDLEADTTWYEEYRLWMLHFACRNNEDRRLLYFENPHEIEDLPLIVQNQLYQHFDNLEEDLGDLKNSLSLPSS